MQLQELKKEFDRSHHEIERFHSLMKKRERILQNINDLKDRMSANMLKMHPLIKKDTAASEQLKEHIAQDSENVDALKQDLKKIDEELDALGEDKEAHHELTKQTLFDEIQKCFPESVVEYRCMHAQIKEERKHLQRLLKDRSLMEPLWETLEKSSSIDLRNNFLDFLFGRSPKALVAHALEHASQQAESAEQQIEDPQIRNYLKKYREETKDHWKKEVQQKKLPQLHRELSRMITEQDQKIARSQRNIQALENDIQQWIHKYTQ